MAWKSKKGKPNKLTDKKSTCLGANILHHNNYFE